ncbi:MAG: hypothetical protein SPL08_02740 [Pseudomonadota bacterium]|nr:hypothetical protein [Pseudomonadota bacterium]
MAEKKEAKETTVAKENKFKKLLTLEPIFINKFASKLKPMIKIIYYILSGILALFLLCALFTIGAMGIASFLITVLMLGLFFLIVRMWAEYIQNG